MSIVEMKGLGLGSSSVGVVRPATTGSRKYGPNLEISDDETADNSSHPECEG